MKEKQRERMMGYFKEATRKIIESEGIDSVSARKVGEEAGYSYATLYNYFSDLNHLLIHVAFDYMSECFEVMKGVKNEHLSPVDQVIAYAECYFKFFDNHPRAFELVYLRNLGGIPEDLASTIPEFGVAMLLRKSLEELVELGRFQVEKIDFFGEMLVSTMHGKMLFYLTGKSPYDGETILKLIGDEVRFILG